MRLLLLASLLVCAGTHAATTYTVTDTGDAGDGTCDATCTLRDAVDAAQADDRILFDLALPAPIVIGLSGPALQIDVPLRITATDGVRTTIRRVANKGRLIDVLAGGDARVVGIGFEDGVEDTAEVHAYGGAILVHALGALELRDCVFRNNFANAVAPNFDAGGWRARGGAIYAAGELRVDGCAFIGNKTDSAIGSFGGYTMDPNGGPAGDSSGGAIHAEGLVDIANTTFSGNIAFAQDGGLGDTNNFDASGGRGGDAYGGAVSLGANAVGTIAFSTMIHNTTRPGEGGLGGAFGVGPQGPPGLASGSAVATAAATVLNTSVIAANEGAPPCAGDALLVARTTNAVDHASCPGNVVVALDTQFDPIDALALSPHYAPKFDSVVVDAAPDCLDAIAFEAVDLDQLLTPRPLTTYLPAGRCDIGAIEFNPVLFADGFEEPPPPP